jgi:peroxidase
LQTWISRAGKIVAFKNKILVRVLFFLKLNEASGSFDLSQLYGYTSNISNKLRSHAGGELKKTRTKFASTLPYTDANNQFCMHNSTNNKVCYLSSDPRINQDPYTTVIYAIFHTSHNQIADALHEINPNWCDEQLFTTAKAINIGLYQKIIYTEWLANVLGEDLASKINAQELPTHTLDPRVTNEFATAAIRFSNSMIPGDLFAFEDQMHGYYGNLLQPSTRGYFNL